MTKPNVGGLSSSYKIDNQNPKKPPTENSSFQQKKLDNEPDNELKNWIASSYKDFKSESTKRLAAA